MLSGIAGKFGSTSNTGTATVSRFCAIDGPPRTAAAAVVAMIARARMWRFMAGLLRASGLIIAKLPPAPATRSPSPARGGGNLLEIRGGSARDVRFLPRGVAMNILGTGEFGPTARGTPIGHARRPRHGEHARIVDGEFDLQS